jgi:hypothetical protein
MAFCSPSGEKNFEKDNTCFSQTALERLVKNWNDTHPTNKISKKKDGAKLSKKDLWKELNKRMSSQCNGSGKEFCWVDKLGAAKKDPLVTKELRPVKPNEWYKKPYAWLSNYDIEAVMEQYQDDDSFKYQFLGVYPIDFEAKDAFGNCLFTEICHINIANLYKKGIRYIGLITNLDKHDQSGSHWTSLFACIDPSKSCFGAYYYDSVSRQPPPEIANFMEKIKKQSLTLVKGTTREFRIDYNENKHQYGNSECGVFSMAYQIRWLDKLKKNPNITFEQIEKIKTNDAKIHKLRNVLFRPNTTALKKKTAT